MSETRTTEAAALMRSFARRSGLEGNAPPRRYLWTDAFAVCNFIGLAQAAAEPHYLELALMLVDQVHRTLGRHRADDPRHGWISGLPEADGAAHPTRGGLRIGKALPERGAGEPMDERLEWERDGQYFHYLTKWMHALDQLSRVTGEARFNAWARELAVVAHAAFSGRRGADGAARMCWKMSVDLHRVLVPATGQHDPLDGYLSSLRLGATARALDDSRSAPELALPTRDFATMLARGSLETTDPLGIGGLLCDALRVAQLEQEAVAVEPGLLGRLLSAARTGLDRYASRGEMRAPADQRLAFRELGLAIGLHAVARMAGTCACTVAAVRAELSALQRHLPLGERIEAFWRQASHQAVPAWREHRDINEVMLATRLLPDGFLALPGPQGEHAKAQSGTVRAPVAGE